MSDGRLQSVMAVVARREVILVLACAAASILFATLSPYYLLGSNLAGIARNSIELLIVSLGMAFVLATAGIDISVGTGMGVAAVCLGYAVQAHWPLVAVVVLGPVVGIGLGCLSAVTVVYGRVPPIIATLGLYGIYQAAIFLILRGQWISGLPGTLDPIVNGRVLDIPVVLLVILALYLTGYVVLRWTPLGTAVLAIGGNENAARLSGIDVVRTKFFVYGMTGLLVGVAAVLYVGRYQNVETGVGATLALNAIVAAILGGSTVTGGRANLVGTAVGVLLVQILQNGFVLIGLPSLWEQVVIGALLIVTLVVDVVVARVHAQAVAR